MAEHILEGYSPMEKACYLGAIASIATADRTASAEELEHLDTLSEAAGLSDEQAAMIRRAATELSSEELNRCLDQLKGSDLRFSLVTDCIAFAQSDGDYGVEEKAAIEKMAAYLGVDKKQFSLLDEFAHEAKARATTPEEAASPQFLESSGLGDRMQKAGINTSGLLKGLLGVMGPIVLAGMLSGGRRRGGLFGGMLGGGGLGGGLLGGLGGGLLGGGMGGLGGGLGSLTGMFGGGGGFRNSGFGRRGGVLGGLFGF
ncbi:TerB family tellurite resistance protein [Flaviaesturariibacter flavus]|uniref:TerB family tellurite resistance protein n=1 Tax=Flaviaesturariibacter flavus TaxID=2502780 RepID=A0A4R1B4R0_9BACT|nr:TerB family tellurite resistance protein [Flaviaesturariibacter flavus]TCJ12460.1 TerB family tellurite resistance protein [Flaviaesturariibacter flavus]